MYAWQMIGHHYQRQRIRQSEQVYVRRVFCPFYMRRFQTSRRTVTRELQNFEQQTIVTGVMLWISRLYRDVIAV